MIGFTDGHDSDVEWASYHMLPFPLDANQIVAHASRPVVKTTQVLIQQVGGDLDWFLLRALYLDTEGAGVERFFRLDEERTLRIHEALVESLAFRHALCAVAPLY